jgi:glycerol kinase
VSRRFLLGIDQGTTGTKAVLFDERLEVVGEAYRAIPVEHPQPGWVEQDPEALVDSIAVTVAQVLPADGEVVGAGLDNQGETIVAWDRETGKALGPALVWQDKRSLEIVERLKSSPRGMEIVERSRLPLDPYFSSTKFRWLLENAPLVQEARRRGSLVLGTSDVFVRQRLGADVATDPSTASRTQLLDLATGRWDAGLLRDFELEADSMPPIHPTVGDLGALSHPSWPTPIRLRASLVDQQAALAGHGCFEPGEIKATYGTGVFVLTNTGGEVPTVEGLLPTIAWELPDGLTYALDGGVFSAGSLLDWLRDELGLFDDVADISAMASSRSDTGGVQVLPALAGLGAPWWRPEATAVIAGLRSSTRKEDIVRAALEAIAQRVADVVERVQERFEVRSISVDGGLTRNDFLVQFQADLLGIPIAYPSTTEVTARGAAALAGIGAGVYQGLGDLSQWLRAPRSVEPQQSSDWRRRQRDAWRAFVASQTSGA